MEKGNGEPRSAFHVLITGTDPSVVRGGIGFVLPGYFAALNAAQLSWEFLPTYHATAWGGRTLWACRGLIQILKRLADTRRRARLIIYSHPGRGVSLLREGLILRIARCFGARTVIQVHSLSVIKYVGQWRGRLLLKFALGGAHVVLTLTPWWKAFIEQQFPEMTIRIVPNPMPPACTEAAWGILASRNDEHTRKQGCARTILAMTRLVPGKGLDTVIEAMSYLPGEYRLLIAGSGPSEKRLKAMVSSLNLDHRVKFLGWVDEEAKISLFREADLFCLPSVNDSFGMVYIEALSNGIPVVAGDWGPIRDVIPEGVGRLVPPNDARATSDAIRELSKRSLDRKAVASTILDRFAPANVAPALQGALEETVKPRV